MRILCQSYKDFYRLRVSRSCAKKIAEQFNTKYKLSMPEEERKGIDGYIGNVPVSLKPITYKHEEMLPEKNRCVYCILRKAKRWIEHFNSNRVREQAEADLAFV